MFGRKLVEKEFAVDELLGIDYFLACQLNEALLNKDDQVPTEQSDLLFHSIIRKMW